VGPFSRIMPGTICHYPLKCAESQSVHAGRSDNNLGRSLYSSILARSFPGFQVEGTEEEETSNDEKHRFCLKIETCKGGINDEHIFVLYTACLEERNKWVSLLNTASAAAKNLIQQGRWRNVLMVQETLRHFSVKFCAGSDVSRDRVCIYHEYHQHRRGASSGRGFKRIAHAPKIGDLLRLLFHGGVSVQCARQRVLAVRHRPLELSGHHSCHYLRDQLSQHKFRWDFRNKDCAGH